MREGAVHIGNNCNTINEVYGDGSGYNQELAACRIATWAIVRPIGSIADQCRQYERLRGTVSGWFSTVPRGELKALIEHMRHADGNETFVSDCQYVVEGARDGVPIRHTASRSANADLWREVKRLQKDMGSVPIVHKTKAHRAWSAAAHDDGEPMHRWCGNRAADAEAKGLAKNIAQQDHRARLTYEAVSRHYAAITRVALGAAWAYQRWPEVERRIGTKADTVEDEGGLNPEDRHCVRRGEGGRLECKLCGKYSRTGRGMAKLRTERCLGPISQAIHHTHCTINSGGIIWCSKCGAYMTRWPRRLAQPCAHRPVSDAQRNVLNRLRNEKAPTTASYLQHEPCQDGSMGLSNGGFNVRDDEPGGRLPPAAAHGRYARLAGGHLYRASATTAASMSTQSANVSARAAEDQRIRVATALVNVTPAEPPTQRRLDGTRRSHAAPARGDPALCQLADGVGWTRRLCVSTTSCAATCNICDYVTRSKCRGCNRAICLTCARGGRACAKAEHGE